MPGAPIECDVCVIGGGPGGSTVARQLATFGLDVCLIERDASPRPRIGASLPATILTLLDVLGARDRVEGAGFLRSKRIVVQWADDSPTVQHLDPPGFHVDRAAFDSLLRENARSSGVRILQPAAASRPERTEDGSWTITVRRERRVDSIRARFVVDATGSRNLLGGGRTSCLPPLFALLAEWKGPARDAQIGAGDTGWFWSAPIASDRSIAAVLFDRRDLRTGEPLDAAYTRLLRFDALGDSRVGRVHACDASATVADDLAGPGFIRVGDAAFTLDPLSSQGIVSAIASSLQAAVVVHTVLRTPAKAGPATAFYRDQQLERMRRHTRTTAMFYRQRAETCGTSFWQARARAAEEEPVETRVATALDPQAGIQLSRESSFDEVPAIHGNLIDLIPAIRHTSLPGPVAFVADIPLVPLLRRLRAGQSAGSVVESWRSEVPAETAWRILDWLWERRIVVGSWS